MDVEHPVKPGQRCGKRCRNGRPCRKHPIPGATVCRLHGGGAPQVRNKARLRAALAQWRFGDTDVDPGEVLLRTISVTAARVQKYAAELAALEAAQGVHGAVTSVSQFVDARGARHATGEQLRALAQLEHDERALLGKLCTAAVSAGLEARRVRLAEQQGSQIAQVLAAVRAHPALALTPEQRAAFGGVVREVLGMTVPQLPAIEA